ncbi:MAG: TolC family protein [Verrucomicrobiales bacterium]
MIIRCRHFVNFVRVSCLVFAGCGSVVAAPKKKGPPAAAAATQGAESAQPLAATPSVLAPAPLPDLYAEIDESGILGRSELILMALRANPRVWRFRSEMAFFAAAEHAAYDWRDPELRIGYSREFEPDVQRPYTERRSIAGSERALETRSSAGTRTETDPPGELSGSVTGGISESRRIVTSGSNRQEIVRRVQPGKYRDIIDETVYEIERERNRESRNQRNIDGSSESERFSENRRRRVISRSREVREHPNDLYPDEAFQVQLQIPIPHPWEMKALAAKARAERTLAEAQMRAEIREVAMDVNERFDELQFWHLWKNQNERLVDLQERNLTTTEKLMKELGAVQIPGIGNLVDIGEVSRARLEISQAEEEVFDSLRRLNEVRAELAYLAGVRDASRIAVSNRAVLRRVDATSLDLATLVELARANRPEFAELRARSDLARAELRQVKARRLPWFNDIRLGWGRQILEGYREQDEFTALLMLNLPLFSWWQNKDHRMHEETIKSLAEAQAGMLRGIDGQVAYALNSVRETSRQLDRHDSHRKRLREFAKQNEADAVAAEAAAAGDKAARIRAATQEELIKTDRGRLQWVHSYHQALNQLEAALGMPLEEVFSQARPSK